MGTFLDDLKNSVDKGEFNSEAAKKIIEIAKLAETKVPVGGFKNEDDLKELQDSVNKRAEDAGIKTVSPEEALKLNSEYEKKMADIKKQDAVNQQLATLIEIEDMVKADINDMLSFVTELENKFQKLITENDQIFKDLGTKIEEIKNKYKSIINN